MPKILAVGVVGSGLIGSELLDQITTAKPRLLEEEGIDIRIVAIVELNNFLDAGPEGLPVGADWRAALAATEKPPAGGFEHFDNALLRVEAIGVVVDCTASQATTRLSPLRLCLFGKKTNELLPDLDDCC
jgi:homoserine dehydrogenase